MGVLISDLKRCSPIISYTVFVLDSIKLFVFESR